MEQLLNEIGEKAERVRAIAADLNAFAVQRMKDMADAKKKEEEKDPK
jgi:hypothetical protein